MPQKRDILDDIIDIQDNWQAVQNPFAGIADSLAQDPSQGEALVQLQPLPAHCCGAG